MLFRSALQLALLAKTGSTTWAGPALCEAFGVGGKPVGDQQSEALLPDDIMEDCFNDMITGQGEGTGWRQNKEQGPGATDRVVRANHATIWGGNLAMLTSLLGTEYFPEIKGGILFLEDVGEHPYRIERMLTQLLHAGVLGRQKAILLGQFTEYKLNSHDKGFKMDTVVQWLRSQIKAPVLTNLPYGHVATKVLLPVGAKTDLHAEGRDVMLFWGHVDGRDAV